MLGIDIPSRLRRLPADLHQLEGLPIRQVTIRRLVEQWPEHCQAELGNRFLVVDPGWALAHLRGPQANLTHWPDVQGRALAARDRLWRYSVATAIAATRFASEAGEPEPEMLGIAGLLHRLGLWGLAATDPNFLAQIIPVHDAETVRNRSFFQCEPTPEIVYWGHELAKRWSCSELVIAANTFEKTKVLPSFQSRIEILKNARRLASRTPWSLDKVAPSANPRDPLLKWLIARVQVATSAPFECRDQSFPYQKVAQVLIDSASLTIEAEAECQRANQEHARLSRLKENPPEQLLEALAEFAAGAAHELNNPLAVIAGRAQLLGLRSQDSEFKDALQAITRQAFRAHQILRDLMYFARPPAPKLEQCYPDEILKKVITNLQPEATQAQVTLSFQPSKSPAFLLGDREGMRHLASVMLLNAIEASPPLSRVEIHSESTSQALCWIVQNQITTLHKVDFENMFNPFYCGRTAGRGLGLGLPRVARFLEQVGGSIHVEQKRKGILRVIVEIPAAPVDSIKPI